MSKQLFEIQDKISRPLDELEERASEDSADFMTSCALLVGYVRAGRSRDARELLEELVASEESSLLVTAGTSGPSKAKSLSAERREQLEILQEVVSNQERIQACRKNLEPKPDDPTLLFDLGVALCCTEDKVNKDCRWIYTELGWFDEANYIFVRLQEIYPDHEGLLRGLEIVKNEKSLIRRHSH